MVRFKSNQLRLGHQNIEKMSAKKDQQLEIIKGMSPAKRLRLAEQLYLSARQVKAAYLKTLHPDWDEEQIQRTVREWLIYANK